MLDQERFDQVLSNLLSNAVKYSNQGGEILITLATDQTEPGFARLSIRDRGIGIEPEKLSRLFNQFYRTEQAEQGGFGGTGLGLYICRLMVEAHNGRIQVESDGLNQGTTFHVMMPFANT
jgi:signal transduction histidine kinase